MTGRRDIRRKQLLDDLQNEGIPLIERRSSRWHVVENSFWKRLWTCKTDYGMNDARRKEVETAGRSVELKIFHNEL